MEAYMSMFTTRLTALTVIFGVIATLFAGGLHSEGFPKNYQQGLSDSLGLIVLLLLGREILLRSGPRKSTQGEVTIPGHTKWNLGAVAERRTCKLWIVFSHSFNCFEGKLEVSTPTRIIAERRFPEGTSANKRIQGYHPAFRRGAKECVFRLPKGIDEEVSVELTLESVRPNAEWRRHLKIGEAESVEVVCVKRFL